MKCTTTAVHCDAEPLPGASAARFAISPLMARGLPRNSVPAVTHSSGGTTPATGAETRIKNWCRSAQEISVTLVSGDARSNFTLPATPPSAPFHDRSPIERDTAATAPAGLLTMYAPPSAWKTTPPLSVSHFCSPSRSHRPWFAPREIEMYLILCGGPPASHRTTSHLPQTAENSRSPTVRARAPPQPSWIAGCPRKISLSRSSKVFVKVALMNVAFSYPGGNADKFLNNFGITCFAHHSAARGPAASAQDCPSKRANSMTGARFSKRPPAGNCTLDRAATFRRSFTMMCRTNGFSPPTSVRPSETASTATFNVSLFSSSSAACCFASSTSATTLLRFCTAPCCFNFHRGVPE
mmetsp:Transcript_9301/g.27903  ORF Transcript_9301/g.27903 Transcript_9301/m.27903 type:complete len:353 (+) Transcript_9301:500-1558(+)